MELALLSEQQLKEIVSNAVETALSRHRVSKEDESTGDEWLTLKQLLVYDPLKRKKPTIYGYIQKNLIPYHKQGKQLLFRKSEIDEWLHKSRYPTKVEIDQRVDKLLSLGD